MVQPQAGYVALPRALGKGGWGSMQRTGCCVPDNPLFSHGDTAFVRGHADVLAAARLAGRWLYDLTGAGAGVGSLRGEWLARGVMPEGADKHDTDGYGSG